MAKASFNERDNDFDFDIIPQPGSWVELDDWNHGVRLEDDPYKDQDWYPQWYDFRIQVNYGYKLPCKVVVTGYKLQHKHGERWIRVKVVIPDDPGNEFFINGDRNPEYKSEGTILPGYMMVTPDEQVHNEEKAARNWARWQAKIEASNRAEADRLAYEAEQQQLREEAEAKAEAERLERLEASKHRASALEV